MFVWKRDLSRTWRRRAPRPASSPCSCSSPRPSPRPRERLRRRGGRRDVAANAARRLRRVERVVADRRGRQVRPAAALARRRRERRAAAVVVGAVGDAPSAPTRAVRSPPCTGAAARGAATSTASTSPPGAPRRCAPVSSPSFDEATPAIWRSTVVFTRRIPGCDVPYVKDLRSSAPSRRLLHARCLETPAGQASIRGSRILVSSVDLSGADEHGAGRKTSEIRRYSARGGASSVLLRQTFGEESNLFGQVAQDDRFAWTVRTGIHQANAFVRVPSGQGARQRSGRSGRSGRASRTRRTAGRCTWSCRTTTARCRRGSSPRRPIRSARPSMPLTPELTVGYTGTPRPGGAARVLGRAHAEDRRGR